MYKSNEKCYKSSNYIYSDVCPFFPSKTGKNRSSQGIKTYLKVSRFVNPNFTYLFAIAFESFWKSL